MCNTYYWFFRKHNLKNILLDEKLFSLFDLELLFCLQMKEQKTLTRTKDELKINSTLNTISSTSGLTLLLPGNTAKDVFWTHDFLGYTKLCEKFILNTFDCSFNFGTMCVCDQFYNGCLATTLKNRSFDWFLPKASFLKGNFKPVKLKINE